VGSVPGSTIIIGSVTKDPTQQIIARHLHQIRHRYQKAEAPSSCPLRSGSPPRSE